MMPGAASAMPSPSFVAGCTWSGSGHRWCSARCCWPARGAAQVTGLAVYAVGVSALFEISALYHRGTWTAAWRRRLQRLDHAMIFCLIAGTATPAFLLDASGVFGLACLLVMWTLTLTAAAIHLAWMSAPELLVGATFVGLGWAGGLALPRVWIHAGVVPGY